MAEKALQLGKRKRIRRKLNLRWTEPQREVATLLSQGKTYNDILEAGYSKGLTSKVQSALKKGQKPKDWAEPLPMKALEPKAQLPQQKVLAPQKPAAPKKPAPSPPSGPPDSAYQTRYHIDISEPVTIGAIQVLPEDWRISQHGYFLIMDTFYLTKEEIGYDGTIGKFIVDVFRFYRQFMQYAALREVGPGIIEQPVKEVSDNGNGRGEEADRGAGIPEESRRRGAEEAVEESGEVDYA